MNELKDFLSAEALDKLNSFKEKLPKYSDDYKKRLHEAQTVITNAGVTGLLFKYNDSVLYAIEYGDTIYKPILINSKLYIKDDSTTLSISDFIISIKKSQQIGLLSCALPETDTE